MKKKGVPNKNHQHVWGTLWVWTNGFRYIYQCWVCEEYGYGV